MKLKLNSEFGKLKAVITHTPGREIERLTPDNTSELLFEDVPFLGGMRREHDEFRNLIKDEAGAKVYRLHDLLVEVLLDSNVKKALFTHALNSTNSVDFMDDILARYSSAECASMLVAGNKDQRINQKTQQ